MPESRECSVCGQPFEFMRTVGRPPEKCSQACRRKANTIKHKAYMRRLTEAREQLKALQAAAQAA